MSWTNCTTDKFGRIHLARYSSQQLIIHGSHSRKWGISLNARSDLLANSITWNQALSRLLSQTRAVPRFHMQILKPRPKTMPHCCNTLTCLLTNSPGIVLIYLWARIAECDFIWSEPESLFSWTVYFRERSELLKFLTYIYSYKNMRKEFLIDFRKPCHRT